MAEARHRISSIVIFFFLNKNILMKGCELGLHSASGQVGGSPGSWAVQETSALRFQKDTFQPSFQSLK